jgi:hypothetical protein
MGWLLLASISLTFALVTILHFADAEFDARWGWRPTQERIPNTFLRTLVGFIWYPSMIIGILPVHFLALIPLALIARLAELLISFIMDLFRAVF